PSWTGATLRSSAALLGWNHSTRHFDANASYKDFGAGFRADVGFVPQVDFRETNADTGWSFRPSGATSRLRTWRTVERQTERDGGALSTESISPGAGMDTLLKGFIRLRYEHDRVRAGDVLIPRQQFVFTGNVSPSHRLTLVGIDGYLGQDADFVNARPGRGGSVNLNATVNATDHLVIESVA